MDTLESIETQSANEPPDYIFDLIQVSLLAAAHDIPGLIAAVDKARAAGADNREILRAMFRSDDAFVAGIENAEFLRLAESLQAGQVPVLSA
ncbi:MAG TPA: hypothetical protein PKM44_14100 [Turneriella sp.]|nr:hypothetical protein [Turneriella sp.]HNE20922.1 hypothetical protein [Turneriella sp.]HNL11645.1 hypothetical protein [Turneriella sp.]